MEFFLFGLLLLKIFGDGSNSNKKYKKQKKTYRHRMRRDESWLDVAWFHDHGQTL